MGIPELPLEPKEPREACHCAWCGDEISPGEIVFRGDEGTAHGECVLDLLEECLGAAFIAQSLGYQEVVAGE